MAIRCLWRGNCIRAHQFNATQIIGQRIPHFILRNPVIARSPVAFLSTDSRDKESTINEVSRLKQRIAELELEQKALELQEATVEAQPDLPWINTQLAISAMETLNSLGLPTWASIVSMTLLLRVTMIPLWISQLRNAHKLSLLQPEIKKLQEDPMIDKLEQATHLQKLYSKHGINPLKSLGMAFVQIPVFITMFFAIRRMANEEYEILQQGFWWIPKLCEADPTYAIPVLTSATMLLTVELGTGELPTENTKALQKKIKMLFRGLSVLMLFGTANFPAGLHLYWITTNIVSLTLGLVNRLNSFKKLIGTDRIPNASSPQIDSPSIAPSKLLNHKPKKS